MGQDITQRHYSVRFTPEELMELIQDQEHPLTPEEIKAMHPADQMTLDFLRKTAVDSPAGPLAMGMPAGVLTGINKGAGVVTQAVTGLAGKAKSAWNHLSPLVGGAIGTTIGNLSGHPVIGGMIGSRLGSKARFGSKGSASGKSPVNRVTPPFADRESTIPEVTEQVKRGVQNNFEPGKRVTFDKSSKDVGPRSPYPPNISTQEDEAALMDRILGTSRQGSPTPLKYHDSAPKGMRKSVDGLKRQAKSPKRRSPK